MDEIVLMPATTCSDPLSVAALYVKSGDRVELDQVLAVVETDKASLDVFLPSRWLDQATPLSIG